NSIATNLNPGHFIADLWFTNLSDGFAQLRQVILDVVTPPLITRQPVSQSLPAGATAKFFVQTAPNALLSFQWLRNGTNLLDGANATGAATDTLTVTNIRPIDSGSYSVILSNAAGSALSLGATLAVTSSRPVIAVQPLCQTVLPSASAT